jgi:HEAT repeat protein
MPSPRKSIKELLYGDSPDYSVILSILTEADIDSLSKVISGKDTFLASKAIYCLGMLKSEKALPVLTLAVKSNDQVLKVAAAQALRQLTHIPEAVNLIKELLIDPDIGVRKFALKAVSISKLSDVQVKEIVQKLSTTEQSEKMKKLVKTVLDEMEGSGISTT